MSGLKFPQGSKRADWLAFVESYISVSQGTDYSQTHASRYAETVFWIPPASKPGARALEVGSTLLFQEVLRHFHSYEEMRGTDFESLREDAA
jgi:hypothetical protein